MENYITSKMSQFGMKKVALTVSPELFQSEQDFWALAAEQEPFSERLDLASHGVGASVSQACRVDTRGTHVSAGDEWRK